MVTGKKIALLAAAILIAGGSATIYAKNAKDVAEDEPAVEQENVVIEQTAVALEDETGADEIITATEPGDYPKEDNSGNNSPDTVPVDGSVPEPPSDTSTLGDLSSSVTVQKSFSDETMSISFYLPNSGLYSVQEKVSGSWQTTEKGINYIGTGGLTAGIIGAGEDEITIRVFVIEDGQYTAVTEEITISRADVMSAGGIKTYHV
jgi:hypothetical protein